MTFYLLPHPAVAGDRMDGSDNYDLATTDTLAHHQRHVPL